MYLKLRDSVYVQEVKELHSSLLSCSDLFFMMCSNVLIMHSLTGYEENKRFVRPKSWTASGNCLVREFDKCILREKPVEKPTFQAYCCNIFETRFSFFINADFHYQVIVLSLFKSPKKHRKYQTFGVELYCWRSRQRVNVLQN